MDPRTNEDPCACPPVIDPYIISKSAYRLFMVYSNYTKVIIYFEPKTCRIKRNVYCYIGEYDIKLNPKESMYLGELMIQEYPSGVYQPGN